ncbi:MAG: MBL fold metallo-hydrolase, partial [Alphaproteobacteria bacterium]|nr:MBL fold metallo-hydrolase [Alphaproteobacteria bacterium]
MKLQVLAVGSRPWQVLRRYWGLSVLIDDTVLFDTFANFDVLSQRLKAARVDVANIAKDVISHDHWDHIGGLDGLLAQRGKGVNVHLPSPTSVARKEQVMALGAAVIEGEAEPLEIAPRLFLLPAMVGEHRGQAVPEQALVAQTEQGYVMI